MVDATPQNDNQESPGDDHATEVIPQSSTAQSPTAASLAPESSAAPAAPVSPDAAVPVSPVPAAPRRKRVFVIAGGIVAAVIVLGGTFGGGVLVGSSVGHVGATGADSQHGRLGSAPSRSDDDTTHSLPGGLGGGPGGVAPRGGTEGTPPGGGSGSSNG